MSVPHETAIDIIAQDTRIEGKIQFNRLARVHGVLIGEIKALDGSSLILGQTAVVEGNIEADTLFIDGFVRGDIRAKTKVTLSPTGRVIGNIFTPSLNIGFGAYFEGQCSMEGVTRTPILTSNSPALKSPQLTT